MAQPNTMFKIVNCQLHEVMSLIRQRYRLRALLEHPKLSGIRSSRSKTSPSAHSRDGCRIPSLVPFGSARLWTRPS